MSDEEIINGLRTLIPEIIIGKSRNQDSSGLTLYMADMEIECWTVISRELFEGWKPEVIDLVRKDFAALKRAAIIIRGRK